MLVKNVIVLKSGAKTVAEVDTEINKILEHYTILSFPATIKGLAIYEFIESLKKDGLVDDASELEALLTYRTQYQYNEAGDDSEGDWSK